MSDSETPDARSLERLVRRQKILYRLALGGAGVLALQLTVIGLGAFQTSAPSTERLLPPPVSSAISVPEWVQGGTGVASRVDLANEPIPDPVSDPTRLVIPAIGVDSPVRPLGRNPNGTAEVPATASYVGWYDLGPRPGQIGPAVLLGHVDSQSGPGVFYRLRSLLPGDIVSVQSGGQVITFEVTHLMAYPKDAFPTAAVFGSTPDAELRLVTCTGTFDAQTGHYLDNLVVFATRTK